MALIAKKGVSASWEKRWRERVYHPSVGTVLPVDWEHVSKIVKSRDKNTCKSCGLKVGLTIHHIIPRDDGGTELLSNLITLCSDCHNRIEELEIKNKSEIIGFKKRKYIPKAPRDKNDDISVDWRSWVYGGYKRPHPNKY